LWWDTATELRAGASLAAALRAAGAEASEPTTVALSPAVAAACLGLEVSSRVRHVPEPSFRWAAAAMEVASADGAGLAEALQRIGDLAAEDRKHRQQQRALLAGSRATARVLLGLPALGALLGWGFGADPVGFLLGTGIGRICLASAIGLAAAGWWWMRVLTRL
jgi:tight adherence protein B